MLPETQTGEDEGGSMLSVRRGTEQHNVLGTRAIVRPDTERRVVIADAPIDIVNRSAATADERTFVDVLVSLAAAAGIVLLIPFVILLIGIPLALVVRGIVDALVWLMTLIG